MPDDGKRIHPARNPRAARDSAATGLHGLLDELAATVTNGSREVLRDAAAQLAVRENQARDRWLEGLTGEDLKRFGSGLKEAAGGIKKRNRGRSAKAKAAQALLERVGEEIEIKELSERAQQKEKQESPPIRKPGHKRLPARRPSPMKKIKHRRSSIFLRYCATPIGSSNGRP